MTGKIIHGDCIGELKKLPENSVDAIITDSPYGLEFMGKEWDKFENNRQRWAGKERKLIGNGSGKGGDFGERFNEIPKKNKRCKLCGHYFYSGTPCKCETPQWETDNSYVNHFQEFTFQWATESLRVIKPGGYLLSFGGTRTYHRMVVGIEDAGFEIRDTIMWLYGSGFPKSFDISKAIDKMGAKNTSWFIDYALKICEEKNIPKKEITNLFLSKSGKPTGWLYNKQTTQALTVEQFNTIKNFLGLPFNDIEEAEREIIGKGKAGLTKGNILTFDGDTEFDITSPSTPEAKEWDGWGTALKPSFEPIVVARKPLSEKNVASNVLKWGTGGLNVDECRIQTKDNDTWYNSNYPHKTNGYNESSYKIDYPRKSMSNDKGRFPSNIIIDEEAGKLIDKQSGILKSGDNCIRQKEGFFMEHGGLGKKGDIQTTYGDKGGASRFFYCAKASNAERNIGLGNGTGSNTYNRKCLNCGKWEQKQGFTDDYTCHCDDPEWEEPQGNIHPTVKPINLMEYLVKLTTRENATVLDPFLGSGTTAIACINLNRNWIGIEKDDSYIKIATDRIEYFKNYVEEKQKFLAKQTTLFNFT